MIPPTKQCSRCKKTKSINDFHLVGNNSLHHLCKECIGSIIYGEGKKSLIFEDVVKYRRFERTIPDKQREKWTSFRKKHKIPTTKGYHFHHWSYDEKYALDVIKISIPFHSKIHTSMRYDKKQGCFKSLDGQLLDTKEKHIKFIQYM